MGSRGAIKLRNEKFAAYVSNHPLEPISSVEAAKQFNCSKTTVADMWKGIPAAIGGTVEGKPGIGFIWTPPYTVKNHEGYSDPTAAKAIERTTAKAKPGAISAGDVRIHTSYSGKLDYIYIVKVFDHHTLSIPVTKVSAESLGDYAYPVEIPGSADQWCMDISCISTRLSKYTSDLVTNLGNDVYDDVLATLRDIFGYETPDDAEIRELTEKLDKMQHNYTDEKANHLITRKDLAESDKNLVACRKEINALTKDIEGLKESIRMRDVRIFDLTKQITEMESMKLDKRAEIELKVMQARLDIYEKELFGGNA